MADKKEVSSFNFKPYDDLPKITELLSYVFIDLLKLDFFDLNYLSCGLSLEIWLLVHRIWVKAAYDANKAAKEADKLRRAHDRLLAKQGEASVAFLFSQLWLIILFSQPRQPCRLL